jgi:hypothetical protein
MSVTLTQEKNEAIILSIFNLMFLLTTDENRHGIQPKERNMDCESSSIQIVCLDYGGAICTYIETSEIHIDEQEDLEIWFEQSGPSHEKLFDWAKKNLTVIFDGNLDQPDNFRSIQAVGIRGPNAVDLSNGSIMLSGFSVYVTVEVEKCLSEDDFEDIFHLIIPAIRDKESTIAFTEFFDYSVIFEEPSMDTLSISEKWVRSVA